MDTKTDDLTGQQINKQDAWKVKIVQPNKATLEIDCAYQDQIENLISLAKKNGQRWFKWKKTADGGLTRDFSSEGMY